MRVSSTRAQEAVALHLQGEQNKIVPLALKIARRGGRMTIKLDRRTVLGTLASTLATPSLAKMPTTSVWTAYDLGSSGYVEASAIADALMKTNPIKVRIVPSGTSIGRLLPLKQGSATYGYLANELYFSTEGLYDFAAPTWFAAGRAHRPRPPVYQWPCDGQGYESRQPQGHQGSAHRLREGQSFGQHQELGLHRFCRPHGEGHPAGLVRQLTMR